MSQSPYVFLLLRVPPQLSGRCHWKPTCLPSSVSLPLCVSLWGGCHHVPLTASRAQYKCRCSGVSKPLCCQAAGPLGPARSVSGLRFLCPGAAKVSGPTKCRKPPGSPVWGIRPLLTYLPRQETHCHPRGGLCAGQLSGKRGLPGTERSSGFVLGTPRLCPPADSTKCPPLNRSQPSVTEDFVPGSPEAWDTQSEATSPGRKPPCSLSSCSS